MKIRLLVLIPLVFVMMGCNKLTEGIVTDKGHRDRYTTTTLVPIIINGKVSGMRPQVTVHPERWWVEVEGTYTKKDGTRIIISEDWTVSRETWNSTSIGDRLRRD